MSTETILPTDELLKMATAGLPITKRKCQCGDPVCKSWFINWTRSDGRMDGEQAELIVRAVNSFEAMREACRLAREALTPARNDEEMTAMNALNKALDLANGPGQQSPRK